MAKKAMPVEKLKATKAKPVPVKIVSDVPSYPEESKKWRAEDALRDIERAEKHKQDKALMKDVKQLAQEKIKGLKGLC